jgi:phage terminase large subunit
MSIPALLAAVHTPSIFNLERIHLQPKQQLFYDSVEEVPTTFYGGAKGGGKSAGLRLIMLLRRLKYPGTAGAIFRRTHKELEGNHIRPIFRDFPELRKYYNESKKIISFPNGSTLEFCHCSKEKDLELYQGREFDDLGIEEAGQWPEGWFRTLQGSNRSSRPGSKPRTLLTGNPGGIGHGWLKRLFVKRLFKPEEHAEDYAFIQAKVYDNTILMKNDPGYVRKLEAEPNLALRKAFLEGDWDIFAGQFFQEISAEVHLIKPFQIPPHWTRFGSYDYGFNHPGAFGWFATDEDGNVYMYREFVKAGLRVDQFAAHLNKFEDTKDLYPIVAGHDCWAQKHNTINQQQGPKPPTIAEEFASHEINLKQAVIHRIQGAARLRSYLAWRDRPPSNKPRLYIFDTCPVTFNCLARMIHDPDNIEDVLKVDATEGDVDTGDDAYDMIRYAMMTRPELSEAPKKVIPVGSPEWHAKQNENLFDQALEHFKAEEDKRNGGWGDSGNF